MSSTQNSPVSRGLPSAAEGFDTISSHDWHDSSQWPSVDDSRWTLTPDDGFAYVVNGVLIKFTHGMTLPESSALIIEGQIVPGLEVELARYSNMRQFLTRADQMNFVNVTDPGGGPITKPFMVFEFNFSKHVFLWSSAGMEGDPPAPKVDKLGIPKFKSMVVRIADNVPFKYHDGTELEIACSRYMVQEYQDPDWEG